MKTSKILISGLVAGFCALAVPVQAATVSLGFGGAPIGAQTGAGYSFSSSSTYSTGGNLYLHDDSGGQRSVTFAQVAGGLFDARSVDMSGIQRLFLSGPNRPPANDPTNFGPSTPLGFNNFQWLGYRNGAVVASDTGSLTSGSMINYLFSAAFTGLQSLQLNFLAPGVSYTVAISGIFGPSGPNQAYCQDYCGSLTIDNLVLADAKVSLVPLPATGMLLFGALGFGAFAGKRRKSARA